jgi:hypothetical protein
LVEHTAENRGVAGSIPALATKKKARSTRAFGLSLADSHRASIVGMLVVR